MSIDRVRFFFHTDRDEPGAEREYGLVSQTSDIPITNPDAEDTGKREVIVSGQLFELYNVFSSEPNECPDIPMFFKLSFQSFVVPQ